MSPLPLRTAEEELGGPSTPTDPRDPQPPSLGGGLLFSLEPFSWPAPPAPSQLSQNAQEDLTEHLSHTSVHGCWRTGWGESPASLGLGGHCSSAPRRPLTCRCPKSRNSDPDSKARNTSTHSKARNSNTHSKARNASRKPGGSPCGRWGSGVMAAGRGQALLGVSCPGS